MLEYKAKQNVKEIFPTLQRNLDRYFYHRICRNRNKFDAVSAFIATDFFLFNDMHNCKHQQWLLSGIFIVGLILHSHTRAKLCAV